VLLIQRYGYHSGALIQLATLSQKSGQFEQAADLLERAVYFLEVCIGSSFRLDDPMVRLPYARKENQAAFVALFKWASMLGKKGCCGCALECCKLLLNWDHTDPLDMCLMVDNFALRAEQYAWLVEFCELKLGMKDFSKYPNLMYGRAFALKELKREKEAREALTQALMVFPECAVSLFSSLGVSCKAVLFSQFGETAPNASLQRVVHIYCTRAKEIWRSKMYQDFVMSVATEMSFQADCEERLEMLKLYAEEGSIHLPSVVKHLILAEEDMEAANNAIPVGILQEALNMDALNAPPPPNSDIAMARLMGSDARVPDMQQQVEAIRRAPTANAVALFLHSLLPWNDPNAPPEQMDEATLMQQMQALIGGFGGGENEGGGNNGENDNNNINYDDYDLDDEMQQDESSHTEEDMLD
jgi:hypothetical protein